MFSYLFVLSSSLIALSPFGRAVPLQEFYTSSKESDRTCLPLEDDASSEKITFHFTFFGLPFDSLYVRNVNLKILYYNYSLYL